MENFNDKFLNICFKLGKVIFSILLLLALIVTVILWGNTAIQFVGKQNVQITYKYQSKPIFDEYIGMAEKDNQEETSFNNTKEKKNDKAMDIIEDFAKTEGIPQNVINETFVLPSNESEAESVSYVNGFISFYNSFVGDIKSYAKDKTDKSEQQIDQFIKENKIEIYSDILNAYTQQYHLEVEKVNSEKAEIENRIFTSFIAALISLAIFILFLFLPILIRIEENTRK